MAQQSQRMQFNQQPGSSGAPANGQVNQNQASWQQQQQRQNLQRQQQQPQQPQPQTQQFQSQSSQMQQQQQQYKPGQPGVQLFLLLYFDQFYFILTF